MIFLIFFLNLSLHTTFYLCNFLSILLFIYFYFIRYFYFSYAPYLFHILCNKLLQPTKSPSQPGTCQAQHPTFMQQFIQIDIPGFFFFYSVLFYSFLTLLTSFCALTYFESTTVNVNSQSH